MKAKAEDVNASQTVGWSSEDLGLWFVVSVSDNEALKLQTNLKLVFFSHLTYRIFFPLFFIKRKGFSQKLNVQTSLNPKLTHPNRKLVVY